MIRLKQLRALSDVNIKIDKRLARYRVIAELGKLILADLKCGRVPT